MNFKKWLELLLEKTLPEWRDHYISYSLLKKRIKLIEAIKSDIITGDSNQVFLNGYEVGFINLLNLELDKLNRFMEEKSRDCHIRLQKLKDRIEKIKNGYTQAAVMSSHERDEVILAGKDLVNLHGELILLENYSVWNFTGLRKILKKYHRRVHAVMGDNYIHWAKCQPFFANEFLLEIISECHEILQCFLCMVLPLYVNAMGEMFQKEVEQSVYKSSMAALEILNEMTKINSAYNDV
ncbi:hypothetical protein SUGI_0758830 [Cryptomeria japonica]|uniref:SPX domain-containing protein 1 n=1 Tax=Cryptomeria japonica TaxID=3369 RepID=UPI002414A0D9|nr:SPX domain-containing protein 1 [Cryptomeria japonica]GLJ37390.1 hypothetical protein SUGI_0758830 [Cryptomeria japonica]